MKSKPPTKKAKPDLSGPPLSSEAVRGTANASPSGSTSSSASSLLSIPPPTSSSTPKAATATTASEIVAAQRIAAANAKAQAAAAASILARAATTPTYPTYPWSDVMEFPRMNMRISGPKASGDVKPAITLGPEGPTTMEDVDALQAELETLWSSLAIKIRSLRSEQMGLLNSSSAGNVASLGEHFDPHHQEKMSAVASIIDAGHGTRTSVTAAAKLVMGAQPAGTSAPSTPTGTISKKTASSASRQDKLPKKKLKGDANGTSKKGNEKPARATQNRSHSVSSGLDGFYKHEAPSEFWEFADNYCGEVLPEHLEQLGEVIEDHKTIPESIFDIPPLGKYFRDGEGSSSRGKNNDKSSKRVDACGPLTQRLVAALVDERVAMYNSQRNHGLGSPREEGSGNGPSNEQGFYHRAGLIKALGLDGGPNRPPMENQLRECLVDHGLLRAGDANDSLLFNQEDEILADINKTQTTLKKLHQYNEEKLGELYNKAKRELERSELKVELDKADKEVMEAYKAMVSMRQKKKPITKKEKDVALKALENRDKALLKLSPSLKNESVGPATVLKVEV